ncbi:MAG TPA: hypothetical protein VLX90_08720 [Steroidobacteraceae bacterium]|nr:hypothetical protein [Steroidobacteraceae bacterium]
MTRELIVFGVALLIGAVGMPFAIWAVGDRILGPYVHGSNPHAGPLALLGDVLAGLAHGALSDWVVVIGPFAIILFLRLAHALLWRRPAATTAPPAASPPSGAPPSASSPSTSPPSTRPPAATAPRASGSVRR